MFKYLKQYRFYITLFFFTLIPIMTIDTSTRAPHQYRFYDHFIIGLTAPIQVMISWSLEKVASSFENYIYLFYVHRDNLVLFNENRKLLNNLANLREIDQENVRLRKLFHFGEKSNIQSMIARVIAKDVSPEFRSIRINRGENSGIKPNMAVMTDEGIVGRVLRTTQKTSDIVTILDLYSAVDAIVERSRARGIVEGLTDDICQLKYALRTDDIQSGDVLVTSGLGGIFPKGIVIGTVSQVNRKPYGITQEVEVYPSVNFSRLEEVLIVLNGDLE